MMETSNLSKPVDLSASTPYLSSADWDWRNRKSEGDACVTRKLQLFTSPVETATIETKAEVLPFPLENSNFATNGRTKFYARRHWIENRKILMLNSKCVRYICSRAWALGLRISVSNALRTSWILSRVKWRDESESLSTSKLLSLPNSESTKANHFPKPTQKRMIISQGTCMRMVCDISW